VQQMTHFIEPKPAGLCEPKNRETLNGIGRVTVLPASTHGFRQDADSFPIANCGCRYPAFRRQFAYRHRPVPLDLKST